MKSRFLSFTCCFIFECISLRNFLKHYFTIETLFGRHWQNITAAFILNPLEAEILSKRMFPNFKEVFTLMYLSNGICGIRTKEYFRFKYLFRNELWVFSIQFVLPVRKLQRNANQKSKYFSKEIYEKCALLGHIEKNIYENRRGKMMKLCEALKLLIFIYLREICMSVRTHLTIFDWNVN